ncbi:sigma-70 family RNA polymerase sigma factor [Amycolatopsis regifaucium]|uniref:RNA polymerase subunit sigma-70 n=1 Tax=Amycolatopsis regifaucium TaxID=546365 RepID=A0A154M5S5_9PSEU|nr:sigma-70 family RNA polymerase sigma factor [Amycolatopsis regifaucium]KZB79843.1 RNA polymerase subunit sigma-70 [Amycolatopsis regifaucium]OKA09840.1 RNA polymerase subunit sigma-70 [Amycolatopsis regifaucium]SFJ33831.1 RNA polymerase sigma-70 factor, ECF subfamily [Amycolatopsis regifaucium]
MDEVAPSTVPADSRAAATAGRLPNPDSRLVRAAVAGDPEAVRELVGFLSPHVFRYCAGRLGNAGTGACDAQDCAQEVLQAVLIALPRYRYRPDRFLAFVLGIAGHKVADLYRRRSREPVASVPEIGDGMTQWARRDPDEIERLEHRIQAGLLLARLPMPHRQVLALRFVFGLSAEETAERLGLPGAGAVRAAQFRALARLRVLLTERNARYATHVRDVEQVAAPELVPV